MAATGDSAGAMMSQWLGFHSDLADPTNADPLKRQSTRLSVIGVPAAQRSMDLRAMAKIIGDEIWQHPSLSVLFGLPADPLHSERAYKLYDEASTESYLTKDDPPVWIYYDVPNIPLTLDTSMIQQMHHPSFGFYLKQKMDKLGVECVIRLRADYKDPDKPVQLQMNEELTQFFVMHFPE